MTTTTREPIIVVDAREDGTATITVDGTTTELREDSLERVIPAAVRHIVNVVAIPYGAPVTVTARNPREGESVLQIAPSGKVTAAPVVEQRPEPQPVDEAQPVDEPQPVDEAQPVDVPQLIETVPAPVIESAPEAAPVVAQDAAPQSAADDRPTEESDSEPTPLPSRRSLRETTFLTTATVVPPATRGARGLLRYVGVTVPASEAELAEREDVAAVSRHYSGTRTIKIGNRKGGIGKTTTVAMLGDVFGRYRGGDVLVWDNNENTGTLGWRTYREEHGASVLDVLRDQDRLLSSAAKRGDFSAYVHHQEKGMYDVLRSDENDEGDHEIQADEVHTVHQIVERYRSLIIMDSGNTLRAANWRAAATHADQLVVPTTTSEDSAEAAKLTLQTLESRDEHSAQLAANAVVIVSQWQRDDYAAAQRIADRFAPFVRAVQIIPFDPALKARFVQYDALKRTTQRAWLAAAAAVARGL